MKRIGIGAAVYIKQCAELLSYQRCPNTVPITNTGNLNMQLAYAMTLLAAAAIAAPVPSVSLSRRSIRRQVF